MAVFLKLNISLGGESANRHANLSVTGPRVTCSEGRRAAGAGGLDWRQEAPLWGRRLNTALSGASPRVPERGRSRLGSGRPNGPPAFHTLWTWVSSKCGFQTLPAEIHSLSLDIGLYVVWVWGTRRRDHTLKTGPRHRADGTVWAPP